MKNGEALQIRPDAGSYGGVNPFDLAAGFWPAAIVNPALSAQARTELLIDAMTLDEKISQIQNIPVPNTDLPGCGFQSLGRHVEGIPRLAIPTLRAVNGGNGVRGGDCVPEPTATAFP